MLLSMNITHLNSNSSFSVVPVFLTIPNYLAITIKGSNKEIQVHVKKGLEPKGANGTHYIFDVDEDIYRWIFELIRYSSLRMCTSCCCSF